MRLCNRLHIKEGVKCQIKIRTEADSPAIVKVTAAAVPVSRETETPVVAAVKAVVEAAAAKAVANQAAATDSLPVQQEGEINRSRPLVLSYLAK